MAYTPKIGDYYRETDGKIWIKFGNSPLDWSNSQVKGVSLPRNATGIEVDRVSKKPINPGAEVYTDADLKRPYEIGPSSGKPSLKTLRYPNVNNLSVSEGTDYVFFEFGKYVSPFEKDGSGNNAESGRNLYNLSATNFKPVGNDGKTATKNIVLPMPQDLSTEFRHDWQGKSFTSLGRAAVAALGAGDFSRAGDLKNNDIFGAFADAIKAAGLNAIPGVGGNISMNDISGSTRGVILNPNAEVLYEAPNLRELGMVFKMFPKNKTEAEDILQICQLFRRYSSPSYGVTDVEVGQYKDKNDVSQTGVNYIRVPYLCKFHFMTGAGVNKKLAQYKPCAMTRVQVNYTPDGTYATYQDGSPVAIELQLGFMETKLIFAEEISYTGEASF